jgi:peptidyl-prolyl cis-trans isomerase SurA
LIILFGIPQFAFKTCARGLRRLIVGLALAVSVLVQAQTAPPLSPVVLDHVVAVVNSRAILASDVNEEMLLSVLEPRGADSAPETPQVALQRIISRTLTRQQIRDEDARSIVPTKEEVQTRLAELRKLLPVCVREGCSTDAGWRTFLENHGLTQARVESYLRGRIEILSFIEQRFKQGLSIPQQDVEAYYHNTLVPQYQTGQTVPPLEVVAPRIEEILLQRQVNAMFSSWLDSLRKQGDVEVLDPALQSPEDASLGGAASQ